jgi:hypothetical protein
MNIMLGNLTIQQIEDRAGVEFGDELKELLSKTHQPSAANVADGKWHCFDMPFTMVCGSMDLAKEIYGHLESSASNFKEPLQIALS